MTGADGHGQCYFFLVQVSLLILPFHMKHGKLTLGGHARHFQKISIAAEAFFGLNGRAIHQLCVRTNSGSDDKIALLCTTVMLGGKDAGIDLSWLVIEQSTRGGKRI